MDYRRLTDREISNLEDRGCRAENWHDVFVTTDFDLSRVARTRFSGEVHIGSLDGTARFPGGLEKPCGVYDSSIHNCTIADGCFIGGVGTLANYSIENNVVVENVGVLAVEGETSFGNGTEIEVLNEGGGRPLKIFDRLSAQVAYLLVLYRHREAMIERLEAMIDRYAKEKASNRGLLAEGCRVENCQMLRNVNVGPFARVQGALRLEEGTIASERDDPAIVGAGVVADKFICLAGSQVTDGAVVSSSFVGQGVRLGKQFSTENSALFANCEGYHGEACSLFAGPYTTTHHKSTLLIAGMFSFYNAGSGTNQSNHMYKLGPLHQGILERGAKTGSSSYLLWPCRIGAFSVVIGKHFSNFDTTDLPFSYIFEAGGKSTLAPAMNLLTVGTRRDAAKWPKRDRRKTTDRLDLINFTLFNPAIVGRMEAAGEILLELYEGAAKSREHVFHNGIQIKRAMLRTGARNYEMALHAALGDRLAARIEPSMEGSTFEAFRSELAKAAEAAKDRWIDAAGMLAPAVVVESLLSSIEKGHTPNFDSLQGSLLEIHEAYAEEEWNWFAALLERRLGKNAGEMTPDDVAGSITAWKESAVKLNKSVLRDAQKEFDESARIGYGIDGDEEVRAVDFEAVRGRYEENSFVRDLLAENAQIEERADRILAWLAGQ